VGDRREFPVVATVSVTWSLLLGAVLRVPSLLQLQSETLRRGWQRLLRLKKAISDDTLAYVLERYKLEDLRGVLVEVNRQLKTNKQFESARIGGLLVVALDANEQFKSRCRCCPECGQRKIKITGKHGDTQEVTEYYHRQVYAHIQGPGMSVILDLESIRPGEEEAQAALRLLARMRRLYGVRFFDVVTVDAWYAKGPFILAVQKMGWGVVVVLKQERFEVYQEATALMEGQVPDRFEEAGRSVALWEVKDLKFTAVRGAVRVVVSQERWRQGVQEGGKRRTQDMLSDWRWLATEEIAPSTGRQIRQIGHRRWGIENDGFNELTRFYHLEHCPRHEPVAIVAWLLIRVLAMNLFEVFARVHSKLMRPGKITLQELVRQLDRALERWEEIEPLRSG
jgi:Transposase DDE domain